jgi:uncharacterized cupin superfamily protein
MQRPAFIKHYSEIQDEDKASYKESDEKFSIGSPFGKIFGLTKLGIHHEVLPPGRRTSWPHAESHEEEFVYVIEGAATVWIDGEIYELKEGDGVGFPAGTGIAHTFINNSESDVRLLVVGEKTKKENKVFYPLNPSRKNHLEDMWWEEVPRRKLGSHNGEPDKR